MTKSELIAEITAFYTVVGNPFEVTSSDEHVPEQINFYSVIVYETGLSEKSKKPVLRSKYINFIVYDEYGPGEAAYYADDELQNNVDADFTGDDSLISISKIYEATQLRKRIRSAMMKTANNIFAEEIPSSLLTANASSGQKIVNVVDGTKFVVDQDVIIADDDANETNTISGISTNELTMLNDLQYNYQTNANAYVTIADNNDRRLWAANVLLDPEKYTLAMTTFAVLDSTVQSSGNAISDAALQTIVDDNVTKLASASRIV